MMSEPRNTRIMFVDDDPDMVPLFEHVGRDPNLSIGVFRSGLAALQFLYDINYDWDAICLDLSMPVLDGLTLTEQIRRNEEIRRVKTPIKLFWVTGYEYDANDATDPLARAFKEFNVTAVFKKPIDPQELAAKVQEYVNAK